YVYMTLRWWKRVDGRQLRFIGTVTGVGLVVGMTVAARLDRRVSTILLAAFVIAVGLRGLLNLAPDYRAPAWAAKLLLFLGGGVLAALHLTLILVRGVLPYSLRNAARPA